MTEELVERLAQIRRSEDAKRSVSPAGTAAMLKYRPFADGLANVANRPFAAVQIRTDERQECASAANREPGHPEAYLQATAGLDDISVLSKPCNGRSLNFSRAVVWRMSV